MGIHFTKSTSGDVYVGPTAIPAFGPENYSRFDNLGLHSLKILYQDACMLLNNSKFRSVAKTEPKFYLDSVFFEAASDLVYGLEKQDLLPTIKCGIRPQLVNWKQRN